MADELQFTPGWLHEDEDLEYLHQDDATFAYADADDAPETFDPRDWLQVEQQGSLGSCAGHAASTATEICEFLETKGDKVQLSRAFAYIFGQHEASIIGDRGCTITGVVKSLKKNGICSEESWPYVADYPAIHDVPEAAIVEARRHKIVNHSYLQSYQETLNYLQSGQGAVIIGIPWTAGLANNQSGVIRSDNSRGKNLGGHAVCLCGWSAPEGGGNPWLILANSHGKKWGKNGFAVCSPGWIDNNAGQRSAEFIGVSDLSSNFKPRTFDFLKDWMRD